MRIECLVECGCTLGEGPLWSRFESRLYWVDIKKPALYWLDFSSGQASRWIMPEPICAVACRADGGLIAAMRQRFVALDTNRRHIQPFGDFTLSQPNERFNDGKCDRLGRFWVGSMDDNEHRPIGDLFRLSADANVRRFHAGFVVTNGIGWSPEGTRMYVTDSTERRIYVCEYDISAGVMQQRQLFASVPDDAGHPDGLTVDSQGYVWSCHWDGGRVRRYTPRGEFDREISLPIQRPTSCTFGGLNLDVLYVTSARIGLDETQLAAQPLSGSLFSISHPGVIGLEEPAFSG